MALKVSTGARNALLNSTDFSAAFDSGALKIYTGSGPAAANDAEDGTLLWSETLPADAFAAAASGAIAKSGTWQANAVATGTAGYFRLVTSSDDGTSSTTQIRLQGTVTATGGGGDLTLDNTSIASGQQVTVNTFTVTAPAS